MNMLHLNKLQNILCIDTRFSLRSTVKFEIWNFLPMPAANSNGQFEYRARSEFITDTRLKCSVSLEFLKDSRKFRCAVENFKFFLCVCMYVFTLFTYMRYLSYLLFSFFFSDSKKKNWSYPGEKGGFKLLLEQGIENNSFPQVGIESAYVPQRVFGSLISTNEWTMFRSLLVQVYHLYRLVRL